MKHIRILLIILISLNFFSSCKKSNPVVKTTNNGSYLPLEKGNYWIYEHYKIDNQGNKTRILGLDSVWVEGTLVSGTDTHYLINASEDSLSESQRSRKTFFVNIRPIFSSSFHSVYDSSGYYMVRSFRQALFSEFNFTDTINKRSNNSISDPLLLSFSKMFKNQNVRFLNSTKPAIVCEHTDMLYKDDSATLGVNSLKYKAFYTKGIGQVKVEYMKPDWGNKTVLKFEKHLVRYNVN